MYAPWTPRGPFHGVMIDVPWSLSAVVPQSLSSVAPFVLALAFSAIVGTAAYRVGLHRGLRAPLLEQDLYARF